MPNKNDIKIKINQRQLIILDSLEICKFLKKFSNLKFGIYQLENKDQEKSNGVDIPMMDEDNIGNPFEDQLTGISL